MKSHSEAICETIGSVMNMARAKGRNVESSNFHKEMVCRMNFPPLHICESSIIPNVASQLTKSGNGNTRSFYRTLDGAVPSLVNKLRAKTLSASLSNYRNLMEEKNNLPLKLFVTK